MGGTLTVDSALGCGATFTVSIPKIRNDDVPELDGDPVAAPEPGRRTAAESLDASV